MSGDNYASARRIAEHVTETLVSMVGSDDARDLLCEYSRKTGYDDADINDACRNLASLNIVVRDAHHAVSGQQVTQMKEMS